MKRIFLLLLPVILTGFVITTSPPQKQKLKLSEEIESDTAEHGNKNIPSVFSLDHIRKSLNCKSCHLCEYPTKNDPCLISCPRTVLASVYRSSSEGPDVVFINEMSDKYSGVFFSHKLHAHMSEITSGCSVCHHYNTTGPILNCKECHENSRFREDPSVPDLKAAYHRQCLSCHKQWSKDNGCNNQCHFRVGSDVDPSKQWAKKAIIGKPHPIIPEPEKMIWETNYENGKIVTFYHNEHYKLFNISCNKCHNNDNCIKCHEKQEKVDFNKPIKIKKSFEEHHKPCIECHKGNNCEKCHRDEEMKPFSHKWKLKSYHSKVACSKCHGNSTPKKVDKNCTSCHKNFTKGFDHKKTGLTLSENHIEIECESCHKNNDFSKNPDCATCHDDKSFPKDLPGKRK